MYSTCRGRRYLYAGYAGVMLYLQQSILLTSYARVHWQFEREAKTKHNKQKKQTVKTLLRVETNITPARCAPGNLSSACRDFRSAILDSGRSFPCICHADNDDPLKYVACTAKRRIKNKIHHVWIAMEGLRELQITPMSSAARKRYIPAPLQKKKKERNTNKSPKIPIQNNGQNQLSSSPPSTSSTKSP